MARYFRGNSLELLTSTLAGLAVASSNLGSAPTHDHSQQQISDIAAGRVFIVRKRRMSRFMAAETTASPARMKKMLNAM